MCGITGFLHFDKYRPANLADLHKMTDCIHHRGPDGTGHYLRNNLALGHRRLSIIDLETGMQPMFSEDKSIVLIFNGEIYNYVELRDELKRYGHHFETTSDSEVIIKGYEQWGIECQNKFNGMWAFALWDENKEQLFLSRDRIGEKPLHYSVFDDTLIFGSEIKAIFSYGVPRVFNTELLEIYLSLSYIPAPFTFYKDIKKLKAGHFIIAKNGRITESSYWDMPQIDENNMLTDKKNIYETFSDFFTDSVKIRMRSDVPYGAFLSGGLDSSSIVAVMSKNSAFPVETFTIGFKEKAFDERELSSLVAKKFHTNHHEYIVEPGLFDESLTDVAYHYDEPFGDSSAIAMGYVSKFAASKVKMVLTGDGGDEVLSGYTSYQGEKFASKYQKLPFWMRSGIPKSLSHLSLGMRGPLRYSFNRMENVSNSSNLSFLNRYLSKSSSIDLSLLKAITRAEKVYPIEQYIEDFMKNCTYQDPFYKLMYLNFKLSLPDDMLVKVDRMSMAHSLETRAPFLDYRLIEYMASVHKDVKMEKYERKSILKNTIAKKLPKALLNAPKKGFSLPLREWFKDDCFNDRLRNLGNINYLDNATIAKIIAANKAGKKDYGNFIWMLFILQKNLTADFQPEFAMS